MWLAYGGINGLTNSKSSSLVGRKVVIVPDIRENALKIMNKKLPYLNAIGVNARIRDMTNGKSDEQLKEEGFYNFDLEDFIRAFWNN